MKIVFLHNGTRALGGGTNFALTFSDVLKGMGNQVVIVDQAETENSLSGAAKDFYWSAGLYWAADPYWGLRSRPVHFKDIREIGRYYDLKHIQSTDIKLMQVPAHHLGPSGYPPFSEELKNTLDDADVVATDNEMLTRLPEVSDRWSNLLYVHFPIGLIPNEDKPWKTVLCNSQFTKRAMATKWEIDGSVVCYPPLYTEFFDYSVPMKDRRYDVVIFSRLVGYKMGPFEQLKRKLPDLRFAIVGSAYGWHPPDGVEVHENATAEEIASILANSKIYAHLRGLEDPGDTEHFGISVASAVASGCLAMVPSHPSGSLEIPSVLPCDSLSNMVSKVESALENIEAIDTEREDRARSMGRFNPANRMDEFKQILEICR